METLSFQVGEFFGPMDVLLSLIAKHKMNICDIAISELLEQYLQYLEDCREQNLELAGEFLEMAARLIYMKTAALLPKPKAAQEEKAELEQALLLYARCKAAAAVLRMQYKENLPYSRQPLKLPMQTYLRTYDRSVLLECFLAMGKKQLPPSQANLQASVQRKVLQPKTVSVLSKIVWLTRKVYRNDTVSLVTLYDDIPDRSARVAVFLAVLELTKHGRICISDDGTSLYRKPKPT